MKILENFYYKLLLIILYTFYNANEYNILLIKLILFCFYR
jgi:hypothetical protein